MSSAWELFFTNQPRRFRFGRPTTAGVELGFDSSLDGISHRHPNSNGRHLHHYNHNNNRRDRHDLDGFDSARRSPHLRHPTPRLTHLERESVRLDQGRRQSASGNNSGEFENIRNSQRSIGNHRLPGAVLLARERLVERLRGVSVSANRQGSGASSGIHHDDFRFNSSFIEPEEGDTFDFARDLLAEMTPLANSNTEAGSLLALQETRKRTPGLTQEALNCLHTEVYNNVEKTDEAIASRASRECSICLESFQDGDELTCLPCWHRFHSSCLEPWVRSCGDCPNCRKGIVTSGYKIP